MKITSGKYKYRKLEMPKDARPTTEKVREAVFSMINSWIEGSMVLDMFAGTGAYGLEALSRGAEHCIFIESSRTGNKVLKSNIAHCGACEVSAIYNTDFKAALKEIADNKFKFDLVFMDPPYEDIHYYTKGLELLHKCDLLDEGSAVVCEHLYYNKLSDTYHNFQKVKEKRYGSIGVDVFIYESNIDDTH